MKKPSIIGHRGARGLFPENTLGGFKIAEDYGCDAVEIDVRLTADGVPVLLHDESVGRTSNGNGSIASMNYERVRKLNFGGGQPAEWEKIPTLEEALEACPLAFHVELKTSSFRKVEDAAKVRGILLKNKERVWVSSDSYEVLDFFRETPLRRALIFPRDKKEDLEKVLERVFEKGGDLDAWHPRYNFCTPELMSEAAKRDIFVHAWTVNTLEEYLNMMELGAHGIFTDRPDLFME